MGCCSLSAMALEALPVPAAQEPVVLDLEEALMGPVVAVLPLLDVAEVGSGTKAANVEDHH